LISKSMLRFVVLLHETPLDAPRPRHYDLMLERPPLAAGAATLASDALPQLQTWACVEFPELGKCTIADELVDHRLAYLDFEGEISGGRGVVRRVAQGTYERLVDSADRVQVRLRGELSSGDPYVGDLTLVRDDRDFYRWRVSLAPGDSFAPPSVAVT
jgi:hypothetical protein